jgi:RNA polymerase sigma-70 factor, ECF subfamily
LTVRSAAVSMCDVLEQGPASSGRRRKAAADARVRAMVDEHFDAVYYALRRFGVPEADLEDCAQQVFMVASGKLATIVPGRERAFLLGTAANKAAHARRTQRRRREAPEEEGEEVVRADVEPGPETIVEQRRLRALFDEVLEAMPEELRAVIVLSELEELSALEIAQALGLPVGTVASRLRRAREEFARLAARAMAQPRRRHS